MRADVSADTIHRLQVSDLVSAHLAVLEALQAMGTSPTTPPLIYNVGAAQGNSVRQLAKACQQATGIAFPVVEHRRRQGDPPFIVGDARKIYAELGWRAQYTNLTQSLEHMWNWRKKIAMIAARDSPQGSPPASAAVVPTLPPVASAAAVAMLPAETGAAGLNLKRRLRRRAGL